MLVLYNETFECQISLFFFKKNINMIIEKLKRKEKKMSIDCIYIESCINSCTLELYIKIIMRRSY
jgi:hypothetical protein